MRKINKTDFPFIAKTDDYKFDEASVRASMKTAFYQDDREEFKKYIKLLSKR